MKRDSGRSGLIYGLIRLMRRRFLIHLLCSAGLVMALAGAPDIARAASGGGAAPAVIELFTSQGCSSCPPADAYLGELADEPGIVALSLPVDYWDYLGWKDTLASPANSERQRTYARSRGDRAIYTPQAVVGGVLHAAGNDAAALKAAVDEARARLRGNEVPLSVVSRDDKLVVMVGNAQADATLKSATLWMVLYSKEEEVTIRRGENAGRTIRYKNVVREMTPIGMWNGSVLSLHLPEQDVMSRGYDGCAVLLQAGPAGPILGAAVLQSW